MISESWSRRSDRELDSDQEDDCGNEATQPNAGELVPRHLQFDPRGALPDPRSRQFD